jgi:hypothetical protein
VTIRSDRWPALRYLSVMLAAILVVASPAMALGATTPTRSATPIALNEDDPNEDIEACEADDPEFGTNCEEDAGDEADNELRDGYLDARQIPGDVITSSWRPSRPPPSPGSCTGSSTRRGISSGHPTSVAG